MAESSPDGQKTLCEKEKLLVMSKLSFSLIVFKRLVPQTHKKPGLVWQRVKMENKHHMAENIVRNGEIASYKQFLLSLQFFFHTCISSVHQNAVLCGNGLSC